MCDAAYDNLNTIRLVFDKDLIKHNEDLEDEKTECKEVTEAAEPTPEFDERGRRQLFRVYHNGGAPISFGSRQFKRERKKNKAARKASR